MCLSNIFHRYISLQGIGDKMEAQKEEEKGIERKLEEAFGREKQRQDRI